MEKVDGFYKKIHGSYFAFIGVAIFFVVLIIAIAVEPNFSLFVHHVSDMGAPTNSMHILFNIGWAITGVLVIFFLLFFTRYLQEKGGNSALIWISFVLGVISAGGIIALSIFNKTDFPDEHLISELIFFVTGILYLILYAAIEAKIDEISKLQAILNLVVAALFVLYLVLLIANRVNPGLCPEIETFTEWLFLFGNLFWFVETGILTLKG
jgi:hypothetical membrane protein